MITNEEINDFTTKNSCEIATDITVATIKGSRFGGSLELGDIVELPETADLYQQLFGKNYGYYIIAKKNGILSKFFVSALFKSTKLYEFDKDEQPIKVQTDANGNALIEKSKSPISRFYEVNSLKATLKKFKTIKVTKKYTKKGVGHFKTTEQSIFDVVFYDFEAEIREEEKPE